ncbi:MAG TPA: phage tail protein [Bacteroides sp.]|nr:phage tail protein [Bacteroides sp.]
MALGGGTFSSQNKVLPGAYFQFISTKGARNVAGERGVAAIALELDWGEDNVIFDLTAADIQKNSMAMLGYSYDSEKLKGIRDILKHAKLVHVYKLTSGGEKASNTYATAKYTGVAGNSIKTVIASNVDNTSAYDVSTYMGTTLVDRQTVTSPAELNDNDYVSFKKDASLTKEAGVSMTGGTNAAADTSAHQAFLDKIESYPDVNTIGYAGTDESIKALYAAFAKRMRDEVGIRLQAVMHGYAGDSIACVNVKNSADNVYWVLGVTAGLAGNESATNMVYDGEMPVKTDYTQKQLEAAIKSGEYVLHKVGSSVRVLEDINSLVTYTDDMGEVFSDNQTVRVIDTLADSIAGIFCTKYIGRVPNNASGRTSLWSDIVSICQQMVDMKALESFDSSDITVEQGTAKKSVVVNSAVVVINTMDKLYMKTVIA